MQTQRSYSQFIYCVALFVCMLGSVNRADAQEQITLADGSRLAVFMVRPTETTNAPSPLLILMGGGPGNASISRDTSMWLGSGFAHKQIGPHSK